MLLCIIFGKKCVNKILSAQVCTVQTHDCLIMLELCVHCCTLVVNICFYVSFTQVKTLNSIYIN